MEQQFKIEVSREETPWNPREDSKVSTMLCWHKRYNLGDDHDIDADAYNGWDEMEEDLRTNHGAVAIKPLYMYEHGGITISTSPFSCQWDSGRLGVVFITKDAYAEMMGYEEPEIEVLERNGYPIERLEQIIDAEVKEYDAYLNGEIYEYHVYEKVIDERGNEYLELVEQCGGYYTEEEARTEAEAVVECARKSWFSRQRVIIHVDK